jgi:hypothetical protein
MVGKAFGALASIGIVVCILGLPGMMGVTFWLCLVVAFIIGVCFGAFFRGVKECVDDNKTKH